MITRREALGVAAFGVLLAVASAIAGVLAWNHGEDLQQNDPYFQMSGIEFMCFALFGAPPLVIIGGTLVFVAAEAAPRPPNPPTIRPSGCARGRQVRWLPIDGIHW